MLVAIVLGALLYGLGKSLGPALEMLASGGSVPSVYLKFGSSFTTAQLIWICLFAPLLEEVVFRVILFDALRRRLSLLAAVVAASTVFALAHLADAGSIEILLLFVSGVCYQVERLRFGSVVYAVVSHALHNVLVVLPKPSIEALLENAGMVATASQTLALLAIASLIILAIAAIERATRAKSSAR